MIVTWELDESIPISSIISCASIILFIAAPDSSALSPAFLISSCFSNHSFDLFASNRALISASVASSSSCFRVTSSAVCLLYNQNRVISCYQGLLPGIWRAELFQTIKFRLAIVIMAAYELCIITSETLATLTRSNNFGHSWECATILFWIHAGIVLLLWPVTLVLEKVMWEKIWGGRNSEMEGIVG